MNLFSQKQNNASNAKRAERKATTVNRRAIVFMILASTFSIDPRVKQEFASLVKKGFFVKVLSWDRDGNNDDERAANYHIKYVKLLRAKTFSKILFLLSALLFQFVAFIEGVKLFRLTSKLVVHANDFNTFLGAVFLKRLFPRKVKLVYDSHELTPAVYAEWYGAVVGSIASKLERQVVKHFDVLIGVSPPIVSHLEAITQHKKRVFLIWNYPSKTILPTIRKEEARKSLGISKDTFLLTYVGALRTDVALLVLIEVARMLQDPLKCNPSTATATAAQRKIHITIVGDGPLYKELAHQISERQLKEVITLTGRVPRTTSLTYLRASDLSYILFKIKGMNTRIGMPWKLFESLACGTKVLVQEKTFAATFVKNHHAGYTIKTPKPQLLTEKLLKLSQAPTLEETSALPFFWEQQENHYCKIYSDLYQEF